LIAASAAKAASATIPIVFQSGEDPIKAGLVASLNRPGGNATGISTMNAVLGTKRPELLRELAPSAGSIFVLANPRYSVSEPMLRELAGVAERTHVDLTALNASSAEDIDIAFASLRARRDGALLVFSDPFLFSRREQIVGLAAGQKLPA